MCSGIGADITGLHHAYTMGYRAINVVRSQCQHNCVFRKLQTDGMYTLAHQN